jgi:hypothetical protein
MTPILWVGMGRLDLDPDLLSQLADRRLVLQQDSPVQHRPGHRTVQTPCVKKQKI